MIIRLTEHERDMWAKAYNIHEDFYRCKWTEEQDYISFTDRIRTEFVNSGEDRLLMHLMLALAEYFDEIGKQNRAQQTPMAEQMTITEVC